MNRAYSILDIKAVDDKPDEFVIRGIASTPTPDRVEDVVEPMGAIFKTPMPLLWQHKTDKPVGQVTFAKPNKNGIPFEASLPKITEPGALKDRVDEAIQSIKYRLVAAVSIGFKPVADAIESIKDGGFRYTKWTWLELSLVTIPANAEATITSFKSIDQEILRAETAKTPVIRQTNTFNLDAGAVRAALGDKAALPVVRWNTTPGASGQTIDVTRMGTSIPKGKSMPTVREHISGLEASRAAKAARMETVLMSSVEKGETPDEAESQEVETLKIEIVAIDKGLKQYHDLETINLTKAVQVTPQSGATPETGTQARSGIVSVARNLPKGTAFTRYVQCLALSNGNIMQAAEVAKRYDDSTPEVYQVLKMAVSMGTTGIQKAAVSPGTTAHATWAAPLVNYQDMVGEFIELLRPQTIVGRIPGLRNVPFNIRVPRTTAGATGGWVGEGLSKPVSNMAFDSITLGFSKVACIVVLTEELVRFSNPSAEAVVRQELIDALTQLIDVSFIDRDRAAVANVSPASITNGVTPVNATGTTVATATANIQSLYGAYATANLSLEGAVWIMNPRTALGLSMLRTAQDIFAFPGITMTGGIFMGLPVIVSGNIPISAVSATETYAILLKPSEIYLADDGGIDIDISREASVSMDSAPTSGAQTLVSFWQQNLIGLKAEHFVNWRKRRDAAVQVWDGLRF